MNELIMVGFAMLFILYGVYKLGFRNGSNIKFVIASIEQIDYRFESGNTFDETMDKIKDLARREAMYKKDNILMKKIIMFVPDDIQKDYGLDKIDTGILTYNTKEKKLELK